MAHAASTQPSKSQLLNQLTILQYHSLNRKSPNLQQSLNLSIAQFSMPYRFGATDREIVTKSLPPGAIAPIEDGSLMNFVKSVRKLEQTRRFSIAPVESGWEVREERDGQVVKRVKCRDWHRVESARRSIAIELEALRGQGWSEESH